MPAPERLPPAVFLMGPTACGKTDLAVALAARFPFEVVSVDSALVYRDMDIGTAKPDAATLAACPHHLIDVVEPTEGYSAGRFRDDALALMADIAGRGRVPLLVGGTMLYFKALKDGLDNLPKADPAIRAELEARAARDGWPALHAELARLDPVSAARIRPTDVQRIERALEVCRLAGRPMSELFSAGQDSPLPYWLIEIALLPSDRARLHERINTRFRAMLAAGFVDEVRALRARYPLEPEMPAMRCVGYRQAWRFLDGEIDEGELYETGAAATRQLAKRQTTWLRGWQGATVFDCLQPDLAEAVSGWLAERLVR
jgi:tRNA dimethylallyltransferase